MGKYSIFIRTYGRPWRRTVPNGQGQLDVDFYDGYVVIRSRQPGVRFRQEIAVTRSAWIALLRGISEPTRRMEGPDFDRNQAERVYLDTLAVLDRDKRQMKRDRAEAAKAEAKRRRYLRAKRRAQRRSEGA